VESGKFRPSNTEVTSRWPLATRSDIQRVKSCRHPATECLSSPSYEELLAVRQRKGLSSRNTELLLDVRQRKGLSSLNTELLLDVRQRVSVVGIVNCYSMSDNIRVSVV